MRILSRLLARIGHFGHMSVDELLESLKVRKLYWEVSELAETAEAMIGFLRLSCPDADPDVAFMHEFVDPKAQELRELRIFLDRPISFASGYYEELRRLHQVWTDELDEVIPSLLRKQNESALGILRENFGDNAVERLLSSRSKKLGECLEEPVLTWGLRRRIADVLCAGKRTSPEERLTEVDECLLLAMTVIGLDEFHGQHLSTLSNESLSVIMKLETLIEAPEFRVNGESKDFVLLCLERQKANLQDFDPIDDSVTDVFNRALSAIGSVLSCLS